MNNPKWILKFLSESQIKEIEQSVKLAETNTSGEIVPVIVRKSSDTYWIPLSLTLIFLLFFYVADGFNFIDHQFQLRVSHGSAHLCAYLVVAGLSVVLFGLSLMLSRCAWVQRLFVPDAIEKEEVEKRAFLEFYSNHVSNTQYQTGILIFVSLMERRTVVLADKSIAAKLPPSTWDEIVLLIVSGIKDGNAAAGLKNAIEKCGMILSQHFPAQPKDINELPNHLIIKE